MSTLPSSLVYRLVLAILLTGTARADVVTDWNSTALSAIKIDRTSPPKAARALAILHVAIYDSVNGQTRTHAPYLVRNWAPRKASTEAAASAAARAVLGQLFPAQQVTFEAAYSAQIATVPDTSHKREGISWGEQVAKKVLAARAHDGADATVPYTPGTNPGDWQPTPPAFAPALLPQWPNLKPFAMRSGTQFRPTPATKIDSAVYAFDLNLVKDLGSVSSTQRTADQTAIARFWADGAGTVTPPGHWNVIARDIAAAQGN